jgi:hypothetical protein
VVISLILLLQGIVPVEMPRFVPPVTQSARCVGVDEHDRPQTLILVSRWVDAEDRTVLFVEKDSSGTLQEGEWLENQNSMYGDSDRKHGIDLSWDDTQFSRHVGDQYVRISLLEHGVDSASVLYVTRRYTDNELTATRYFHGGAIHLVGHCTLFVGGEKRNSRNWPQLGPVPR